MKKVKFYLGIGYANCDQEEIMEYPDDTPEKDINEALEDWAWNYIEMAAIPMED